MDKRLPAVHFTEKYLLAPTNPVTVSLIGAGGTGSQVLTSLGRINISLIAMGHPGIFVTLIDDDRITHANCGRQLFTEQEIGLYKSATLISRVNRFFGTSWKASIMKVNSKAENSLNPSNLTISCVDTAKSRFELSKMFSKMRNRTHYRDAPYYWMDFGNDRDTGQVLLSTVSEIKQPESAKFRTVGKLPPITEEFCDLLKAAKDDDTPSCSMADALSKQDLFINSSVCALGCSILWKMFSKGMLFNRGFFLNLNTLKTEAIKI